MIKFNNTLAAAVLGFSLCLSGAAFATIPGSAPSGGPVIDEDAGGQPSADQVYEMNHQGAVAVLTKFKGLLTSAKVAPTLAQLATEMAKLPGLQSAYVDAKAAGKDADAKAALDAYTAAAQKIVELALPLEQLAQMHAGFLARFDAMGAVGAKLKAETDVAALLKDIGTAVKPLLDANEVIGPLEAAAAEAAQPRIEKQSEAIFNEELAKQVETALNAHLTK